MVVDFESRLCWGAFDSHLGYVKTFDDFTVEECVTQYYEKDGKWFWYCMTCHTGSGKRPQHLKGHKGEGDALVATKYHRNAKRVQRKMELYRAWWWKEIMTTQDLDYFLKLWTTHYPEIKRDVDQEDLMATVQSDNCLWDYMIKLNKGINGHLGHSDQGNNCRTDRG